jgi:hypothetical protein
MITIWQKYQWVIAAVLMVVLVLAGVSTVRAYQDDDGIIGPDEVINDDAYISADTVSVKGTVNGNLFASGAQVTIDGVVDGNLFVGSEYTELTGKISGDAILSGRVVVISEEAEIGGHLICGAQTIDVRGSIGRSIYCGGYTLTLDTSADIGDNIFFGGYSLKTRSGSNVGRDIFAGLYQASLGGDIGRNLTLGGAALELSGNVGRNVTLEIDEGDENAPDMGPMFAMWFQMETPEKVAVGLNVAESSEIGGKLTYTSPTQLSVGIEAVPEGGVAFQTPVPAPEADGASPPPDESARDRGVIGAILMRLLKGMRQFATLMILGGLLLWLLPKASQGVVDQVRTKPLPAALYGFLAIIIGYAGSLFVMVAILMIGFLFLAMTLVGLGLTVLGAGLSALTLVMVLFTAVVLWGSKLAVAYMIGEWIVNRFVSTTDYRRVLALIVGVVIYVIVWLIPIVGFLAALAATLVGLGAMWLYFRASRSQGVVEAIVED